MFTANTIGRVGAWPTAALSLALLACGGSSASPGGGTNPPTEPPPPQNVTITLVSRNLDANADAGQLYAYVGDAVITRATMPSVLNENAPTLRLNPGSS
ncbi:MAG: hypothetical protein JNL26_11940, partial [Gemmatimonadetes bacterium]|nr:hypothetical protein [Gemmatimonadota bacterium]